MANPEWSRVYPQSFHFVHLPHTGNSPNKKHKKAGCWCKTAFAAAVVITSLFGWLVADGWCWFVLREEYCWLVSGGWFVLR
jgi:hypothetical protein